MKKCPFCAEEVQDEALICKHCQRTIVAHKVTDPSAGPPGLSVARMAGAFLLILGLAGFFFAFNMDVTVEVPVTFGVPGGGGRVNNIGLMADRNMYLLASGIGIFSGLLLVAFGGRLSGQSR